MSRADNGVDDVDDEFTRQAKDAANAAAARDDVADDVPAKDAEPKVADKADKTVAAAKPTAGKDAVKKSGDSSGDAAATSKRSRREPKPAKIASGLNPSWWVPTMLGLMVLGLVWLVVFYLSGSKYPVPGIGTWNLAIGFVLLMSGFAMTTRWK